MGRSPIVQVDDVSSHLVVGFLGLCCSLSCLLFVGRRDILEHRAGSCEGPRGEVNTLVKSLGVVPNGLLRIAGVMTNLSHCLVKCSH